MAPYQLPAPHYSAGNTKESLMPIPYSRELNPEQHAVVTQGDGICLVLAGAGSGKTRTLVYRIAYLIEHGVDPSSIMLVTFTNKAAREMVQRVSALLGNVPRGMWMGTFHHIGNRILRSHAPHIGISPSFSILDKEDSKSLIRSLVKELNVATKQKRFPKPEALAALFSYAANARRTCEEVIHERFPNAPDSVQKEILQIYDAYRMKKSKANVVDFDDLLTLWLSLLEQNESARDRLSSQFQYILVDEYQDTNRVQSDIMHHLSSCHRNLLVVGDDAQSIYSFRAADIGNILAFPDRYPSVKIFKLETNYRSTPAILALANASLNHNSSQYEKQLRPAKKHAGELPMLIAARDAYAQASYVADTVLTLADEGIPLSRMAVLFRAAYQTIELELELAQRDIPYTMRGGLRFFEQAHIKDVLAPLRILRNIHDEIAWRRALLLLPGIGPASARQIMETALQYTDFSAALAAIKGRLPSRGQKEILQFLNLLASLAKLIASARERKSPDPINILIKQILEAGYEEYVLATYDDGKERAEDIRQMAAFGEHYTSLDSFLADSALSEGFKGERQKEEASGNDEIEDRLVLSTIHQAKGLEWHTVFMIGLAEGQFPHRKVYERPKEMEEERRLFYVAATRAQEKLFLLYPIASHGFSDSGFLNRPSSFLQELPEETYQLWKPPQADGKFFSEEGILDRIISLEKE